MVRPPSDIPSARFCEETLGGEAEVLRTEPYIPDEVVCVVQGGDPYEDGDVIFSISDEFRCGGAEADI